MTRQVPHYHLEYALRHGPKDWTVHVIPIRDPSEAERAAAFRRALPDYVCVRVTGPHQHEVPE